MMLEDQLDAGMHVETDSGPIDLSDDDSPEHVEPDGAAVMDELAEAFNARDLDHLLELCAPDCEAPGLATDLDHLGETLADLWDRRPTVRISRDVHEGRAVGIVWEHVDNGWAGIGTVHLDILDDELVGCIEFSDDPTLLDELDGIAPDEELPEGATWDEWDANPDT